MYKYKIEYSALIHFNFILGARALTENEQQKRRTTKNTDLQQIIDDSWVPMEERFKPVFNFIFEKNVKVKCSLGINKLTSLIKWYD